ncbi:hypothetical protein ANN_22686 [Periplaneta americana]|uniref:Uncharacterized protein n=1 Tax=Periplaneta americana TaxID=6978 RepID=A0ABQ8S9R1_PERAM|nr:hypothetical protein ANN_22686 [Periplaneta americana]
MRSQVERGDTGVTDKKDGDYIFCDTEVMDKHREGTSKGEDRCPAEQLATSVGEEQKTNSGQTQNKPTPTSTGAERNVTGNNCEAEQQVAPSTDTTLEAAHAKDEKHAEVDKLTRKMEEVTDFLTNQLGKIIQELIKKILEKENLSNPERTTAKRVDTQKMYNDWQEHEKKQYGTETNNWAKRTHRNARKET